MAQHRKNHILTLVLYLSLVGVFAHAAPSTSIPPDPIDVRGNSPNPESEKKQELIETSQITPVQSPKMDGDEYPIVATRRLTKEAQFLGVSYWMGSIYTNGADNSLLSALYGRTYYDQAQFAHEYTLELASSGSVGGSLGYKWLLDLGSHYEPYYKVSLGAVYSAADGLATLINWKRYQLRGEFGFEDFLNEHRQYRTNLGVSWSGFGIGFYVAADYAF